MSAERARSAARPIDLRRGDVATLADMPGAGGESLRRRARCSARGRQQGAVGRQHRRIAEMRRFREAVERGCGHCELGSRRAQRGAGGRQQRRRQLPAHHRTVLEALPRRAVGRALRREDELSKRDHDDHHAERGRRHNHGPWTQQPSPDRLLPSEPRRRSFELIPQPRSRSSTTAPPRCMYRRPSVSDDCYLRTNRPAGNALPRGT
jgi:hypothetical protein